MKSEFLKIMTERGFFNQCTDLDGLDAHLVGGVRRGYLGFDATATSLHVGNLVGIMALYWFQKCGHKPITLMGGATTRIGDPSGKNDQRKLLDSAAIDGNIGRIRGVFGQFLKYGNGVTDAQFVNNADWFMDIKYIDFLRDVGRYFSVNRMLTMDSVRTRLERDQPLSFLEFNYMVMQGYDFVHLHDSLGVTVQFGGSDQWGNIVSGVDLGHRARPGKEGRDSDFFAMTWPLLTKSDGTKMGKSVSGAVWLNADMLSPYDYYQFWRNTADSDVGKMLATFTTLPMDEVRRLGALKDAEINEAKKILAFEATKLCHGEGVARDAEGTARATFEQGGIGGDLPTLVFGMKNMQEEGGIPISGVFIKLGFVASKGEFVRLVAGKGIRIDDQPFDDPTLKFTLNYLAGRQQVKLSVGKKKHGIVVFKDDLQL